VNVPLGGVGQPDCAEPAGAEQGGHHDHGYGAVEVDQEPEHHVAQDGRYTTHARLEPKRCGPGGREKTLP